MVIQHLNTLVINKYNEVTKYFYFVTGRAEDLSVTLLDDLNKYTLSSSVISSEMNCMLLK